MIEQHDIHAMVEELTRAHTHRQPYLVRERGTTWTRRHITRVPALLEQLQQATPSGTGEASGGGYKSRPAAHLEALDTLVHIDLAAARWVRDLGEDDPADTARCVRLLHALWPSTESCSSQRGHDACCARHAIERDVRRWWTAARIVTGWDSQAWRPDNTCPVCATRGTLRVRLAAQAALCIECRELWTPETIGLLADHIRAENRDTTDAQWSSGA